MTDSEYLNNQPIPLDDYAFSERVSIKLESINNPSEAKIEQIRQEAYLEMTQLGI